MAENTPQISHATAYLLANLPFIRKTSICDVGANPINVPPYAGLLAAGACRVTGFEPNPEAFGLLLDQKGEDEIYHNVAVGDGSELDLHLYATATMTSVFPPHAPGYRAIGAEGWGRVKAVEKLKTVALDSLDGLDPFDCLKIDIQGGELLVFQNARRMLADAVCVIVEMRYMQLYEGEPMIGGVDEELRAQGFMLHKFMFNKSRPMPNSQMARLRRRRVLDQLVDGDGVYLRHPGRIEDWTDDQLCHGAILGSAVFESHSFVLYCLDELVRRGGIDENAPSLYVDALPDDLRVEPETAETRPAARRRAAG